MNQYQMLLKKKRRTEIINFLIGSLIYAIGFNVLVVPMGLYSGGFMGISQLIVLGLKAGLHVPVPAGVNLTGIIYFVLNAPLFYMGYRILGKKFTVKTLFVVGIQSLFLIIVPIPKVPLVDDYLTSCIIGGIVTGYGCGLVLKGRASSGGQDIIGLCGAKRNPDFSVGKISIVMNIFIYAVCFFVFNIEIVIYSLIYATLLSIIVDRVHTQNINTGVMVFTKEAGISKEIIEKTGRGVTMWKGEGAYTSDEVQILYIVVSKYEVPEIKEIVHGIDPHAFMIFEDGCSIEGNFEKRL